MNPCFYFASFHLKVSCDLTHTEPRRHPSHGHLLNELNVRLRSSVPLDGARGERGGKDDMRSGESLTDVAEGCVPREVENRRGEVGRGRVSAKKERGIDCLQACYSTLQCYPRERAHHDCLAERASKRNGECALLLPSE